MAPQATPPEQIYMFVRIAGLYRASRRVQLQTFTKKATVVLVAPQATPTEQSSGGGGRGEPGAANETDAGASWDSVLLDSASGAFVLAVEDESKTVRLALAGTLTSLGLADLAAVVGTPAALSASSQLSKFCPSAKQVAGHQHGPNADLICQVADFLLDLMHDEAIGPNADSIFQVADFQLDLIQGKDDVIRHEASKGLLLLCGSCQEADAVRVSRQGGGSRVVAGSLLMALIDDEMVPSISACLFDRVPQLESAEPASLAVLPSRIVNSTRGASLECTANGTALSVAVGTTVGAGTVPGVDGADAVSYSSPQFTATIQLNPGSSAHGFTGGQQAEAVIQHRVGLPYLFQPVVSVTARQGTQCPDEPPSNLWMMFPSAATYSVQLPPPCSLKHTLLSPCTLQVKLSTSSPPTSSQVLLFIPTPCLLPTSLGDDGGQCGWVGQPNAELDVPPMICGPIAAEACVVLLGGGGLFRCISSVCRFHIQTQ
eukprot:gene11879-14985_t